MMENPVTVGDLIACHDSRQALATFARSVVLSQVDREAAQAFTKLKAATLDPQPGK